MLLSFVSWDAKPESRARRVEHLHGLQANEGSHDSPEFGIHLYFLSL